MSENQERTNVQMSQEEIAGAVNALHANYERVRQQLGGVIVGMEEITEQLMIGILCRGHCIVQGMPGLAKTLLISQLASLMDLSFVRIQFTPDLMPADITGIHFYNQRTGEFQFREGPLMSQVVLADEINRATPRTQSALLEAMEERQLTVEGETTILPRPFLVMATQNPVELEGTFPLPEAQLDRFLLRLELGYPNEDDEDQILARFESENPLDELTPAVSAEDLIAHSRALGKLHVDPSIRRYAVQIVRATRDETAFELGASPRASLGLFRASRAHAAINGRDFVLPDDVKTMAPHVLAHRLILSTNARLRGRDTREVLADLLERIPVPVER